MENIQYLLIYTHTKPAPDTRNQEQMVALELEPEFKGPEF